jgi:hypothetical protein
VAAMASRLCIIPIYNTPLGAQKLDKTSQNSLDVEEFLAGLRFEQKGKLEELSIKYWQNI